MGLNLTDPGALRREPEGAQCAARLWPVRLQADGGDLVLIRADVETGVVEVATSGRLYPVVPISSDTCKARHEDLKDRVWRGLPDGVGGVDDRSTPRLDVLVCGYVPRYGSYSDVQSRTAVLWM